MAQRDKLIIQILRGASDTNIRFSALCDVLVYVGFQERIRSSHHIFTMEGIEEIINLQPKSGKAKAYQVKQVRGILVKYQLGGNDD